MFRSAACGDALKLTAMKTDIECDWVRFVMSPFGRRVEVSAGLPRRERDLSLYVPFSPGVEGYAWGEKCAGSYELARAILTFTFSGLGSDAEVPEDFVGRFVDEVVSAHDASRRWSVSVMEVLVWLAK